MSSFAILNERYHEQEDIYHRPGRRARRIHHRHQHGRPRHRHSAGGNMEMRVRHELKDMSEGPEREAGMPTAAKRIARLKEKALQQAALFVLAHRADTRRRPHPTNQLRGRSAGRCDPGIPSSSCRSKRPERSSARQARTMLQRLGLKENEAIVPSWINKRWRRRSRGRGAQTSTSASFWAFQVRQRDERQSKVIFDSAWNG